MSVTAPGNVNVQAVVESFAILAHRDICMHVNASETCESAIPRPYQQK